MVIPMLILAAMMTNIVFRFRSFRDHVTAGV